METTSVRIDDGIVELVRRYKAATGFPIARFIEDAILAKIDKLPKSVKEKAKIIPSE